MCGWKIYVIYYLYQLFRKSCFNAPANTSYSYTLLRIISWSLQWWPTREFWHTAYRRPAWRTTTGELSASRSFGLRIQSPGSPTWRHILSWRTWLQSNTATSTWWSLSLRILSGSSRTSWRTRTPPRPKTSWRTGSSTITASPTSRRLRGSSR